MHLWSCFSFKVPIQAWHLHNWISIHYLPPWKSRFISSQPCVVCPTWVLSISSSQSAAVYPSAHTCPRFSTSQSAAPLAHECPRFSTSQSAAVHPLAHACPRFNTSQCPGFSTSQCPRFSTSWTVVVLYLHMHIPNSSLHHFINQQICILCSCMSQIQHFKMSQIQTWHVPDSALDMSQIQHLTLSQIQQHLTLSQIQTWHVPDSALDIVPDSAALDTVPDSDLTCPRFSTWHCPRFSSTWHCPRFSTWQAAAVCPWRWFLSTLWPPGPGREQTETTGCRSRWPQERPLGLGPAQGHPPWSSHPLSPLLHQSVHPVHLCLKTYAHSL